MEFSCLNSGWMMTGSFLSYRVNFTVRFTDVDDFQKNMKKHHKMLNPSITFILKKGKYPPEVEEASYGTDAQGRLKIRFQSFLRFHDAAAAFESVLELSRYVTVFTVTLISNTVS